MSQQRVDFNDHGWIIIPKNGSPEVRSATEYARLAQRETVSAVSSRILAELSVQQIGDLAVAMETQLNSGGSSQGYFLEQLRLGKQAFVEGVCLYLYSGYINGTHRRACGDNSAVDPAVAGRLTEQAVRVFIDSLLELVSAETAAYNAGLDMLGYAIDDQPHPDLLHYEREATHRLRVILDSVDWTSRGDPLTPCTADILQVLADGADPNVINDGVAVDALRRSLPGIVECQGIGVPSLVRILRAMIMAGWQYPVNLLMMVSRAAFAEAGLLDRLPAGLWAEELSEKERQRAHARSMTAHNRATALAREARAGIVVSAGTARARQRT